LEWSAEVRRGWGPIYSPHRFMTVGGVRTSDIFDGRFKLAQVQLSWIYLMGLGYICL
jgi:hypothetical protein